MSLDAIATGSAVLLDANILIYAHLGQSAECGRLLERCALGELRGVLPAHILAEICHTLMSLEARVKVGMDNPQGHRTLLEKPAEVKKLGDYADAVRRLLSCGLLIEPVVKEDFSTALEFQKQWGLLTNDSLLLAVGSRLSLNILASADKGFRLATRWKLYAPADIFITP